MKENTILFYEAKELNGSDSNGCWNSNTFNIFIRLPMIIGGGIASYILFYYIFGHQWMSEYPYNSSLGTIGVALCLFLPGAFAGFGISTFFSLCCFPSNQKLILYQPNNFPSAQNSHYINVFNHIPKDY